MPDNAFVKIGTALFKHQMKKLVGEETLEVIGAELADLGGDKLDAWLGDKSTIEQLEKAAATARDNFRGKVNDDEVEQWVVMLPIHNLPDVISAIEELPTSPDETKLEYALRESIALNWKRLSPEQVDNAVNSFLSCLRSALLPIEKQTLMVIGRSVLRTEDKVDLLLRWFEQYIITGKSVEIKQLNPEPVETWNLKHPYAMPPNFTGRVEERKMLVDWLNNDNENRLFILRALGGFGKSALSWHWLTHDVDSKEWKKVLWWSFYEGDASFEHFIEETLNYLKLEIPQGQRPQVDELLKAMQAQKILLIMDGFERALRAYSSMNAAYQGDESPLPAGEGQGEGAHDCVNINAEIFLKSVCSLPSIKSKILMTTRLTPRAIKPRGEFVLGCREVELTSMQKADAVEFFRKQKIKGTHAEIEAACAPYGYHPLSLRLLAGRILKDFENPADIVVAQKFKIDGDIKAQKHHVLEVAYTSLSEQEQKLLSTIACFRSSVELKALEYILKNKNNLDINLHELVDRGLLHFDEKNKKFDLHPIVRRYTYEHFPAPDRTKVHTRLCDYYNPPRLLTIRLGSQVSWELEYDIELYYHRVKAGEFDKALNLFPDHLIEPLYSELGAHQTIIELLGMLFIDGKDKPPKVKNKYAQGWALNSIGNAYSRNGQPLQAIKAFELSIKILNKLKNRRNLVVTLANLAELGQINVGSLKLAVENLEQSILLCNELLVNEKEEIRVLEELASREALGLAFSYCGKWQEAEIEFMKAIDMAEKINALQPESILWSRSSLMLLLISRDPKRSTVDHRKGAVKTAQIAAELTIKHAKSEFPVARDYAFILWILGSAYRLNRKFKLAEQHLSEALTRDRAINMVEIEANILLDLVRLRYDQKKYEDAKSLADEALLITERCGYVLQGADVNLFLAQFALEQEKDKAKAKGYAETALRLAYCDGPPYYYKVAYEEAERMLEKLK